VAGEGGDVLVEDRERVPIGGLAAGVEGERDGGRAPV
jgi:hypothetical protein